MEKRRYPKLDSKRFGGEKVPIVSIDYEGQVCLRKK